jgi:hypothetical protein
MRKAQFIRTLADSVSPRSESPLVPINSIENPLNVAIALMDSGSDTNLIRSDIAIKWKLQISTDSTPHLTAADGRSIATVGSTNVRFKIGNKEYVEDFLVVENLHAEAIIGFPFLTKSKLMVVKVPPSHNEEQRNIEAIPKPEVPVTDTENLPVTASVEHLRREFHTLFDEKLAAEGANVAPLKIRFRENVVMPKATPPRITSPARKAIIEELLEEQLSLGIIKEVHTNDLTRSSYVAPVVLVPKPGGRWRLTVDYKAINPLLVPHPWPMAHTQDCIRSLAGFKHYAKLDLRRGFDQLPIEEESAHLLMFTANGRVFAPRRVSQGLSISPTHFQHVMQVLLAEPIRSGKTVVYADDIVICSHSLEEHIKNLRHVFHLLQEARFRLNSDKCRLDESSISYLGFEIDGSGQRISPTRMEAFANLRMPETVAQLRSLLGATNFVRQFIPSYQALAQPLYAAIPSSSSTTRSNTRIVLTDALTSAFNKFKAALLAAHPLAHVDYSKPLVVQTDASDKALGAVLLNGGTPVSFVSKTFSGSEINWSTIDKEAHAIFYAVKKFESFLLGHKFTIETDSRNLTFLSTSRTPRVIRMWVELQEFDFTVRHIEGKTNLIADLISRSPASPIVAAIQMTHGPQTLTEVINRYHNGLVGHGGIEATLQKLEASGYCWPGMQKDVEAYVRGCGICQKSAPVSSESPISVPYHTFVKTPFISLPDKNKGFPRNGSCALTGNWSRGKPRNNHVRSGWRLCQRPHRRSSRSLRYSSSSEHCSRPPEQWYG